MQEPRGNHSPRKASTRLLENDCFLSLKADMREPVGNSTGIRNFPCFCKSLLFWFGVTTLRKVSQGDST